MLHKLNHKTLYYFIFSTIMFAQTGRIHLNVYFISIMNIYNYIITTICISGPFFNFLQINLRQYVCNSNYYIQKSINESKNLHPKQVIAIRNNPKEKVMRGKQCSFFPFEPLFEIVNWAWNTNVPVDTTQQAGLGMRKIQITYMNNTTYPQFCILYKCK